MGRQKPGTKNYFFSTTEETWDWTKHIQCDKIIMFWNFTIIYVITFFDLLFLLLVSMSTFQISYSYIPNPVFHRFFLSLVYMIMLLLVTFAIWVISRQGHRCVIIFELTIQTCANISWINTKIYLVSQHTILAIWFRQMNKCILNLCFKILKWKDWHLQHTNIHGKK